MDRLFSGRDLAKLLIPLIIEQILSALMGTADTLMVARIGEAAVSGVSNVDAINNLMLNILVALATGGTITCAQYLGAGEPVEANKAARQVLMVVTFVSVIFCAVCACMRAPILRLIFGGVEQDVMDAALVYFLITAMSYPFMGAYYASAALYRAAGNARLPMVISVICNGLNILGNAVFLFVLGWGAMGAALATTLSRIVQCLVILLCHRRQGQTIVLRDYHKIRPDLKMIKTVLRIGIPTGVENGVFQMGRLLVQSTVATLSTAEIAAQAVVNTLEFFTSMPSQAVGLGLVTVVGQCMGAGRKKEARQNIILLTAISEFLVVTVGLVIFAVTKPVIQLSGLSSQSGAIVYRMMLLITIVKPFVWPLAFTPPNGMRAAGDVSFCMLVSVLSMWIFRVVLCVVLIRVFHFGVIGVWIAMFVDWGDRALWNIWRFFSGKWMEKKVLD